jgi:hypothetical protein
MWPFKPNDWKVVHTARHDFVRTSTWDGRKIPGTEKNLSTLYILKYSESRKKFKIAIEGERSATLYCNEAYQECLDKQIDFLASQK